jgi:hypothetical protein
MNQTNNWIQSLTNPVGHIVKKYMYEILESRYAKHEDIIERISKSLITHNDIDNFGKLVADIYESGFFKAVSENKDAWEKLGYKPIIKQSEPNAAQKNSSIFNQKNQE